jgi:hypothetical protein
MARKSDINILAFTSCQRQSSLLKTKAETGIFSFHKNLNLPSPTRWNFELFQRPESTGGLLFRLEKVLSRPIGSGSAELNHKMQTVVMKKK